jgi:geranylgeranyl diphosphate synthase type 3
MDVSKIVVHHHGTLHRPPPLEQERKMFKLKNDVIEQLKPEQKEEEEDDDDNSTNSTMLLSSPTSSFVLSHKEEISHEIDLKVLEPFTFVHLNPFSKNIRDVICDGLNVWIALDNHEDDEDAVMKIKSCIGELHSASLIVDDIEDQSEVRRGKPSSHLQFGLSRALNAANYAYFIAMQKLSSLQDPNLMNIYCEEMLNLHRGQGLDILWRDTFHIPTEDEYMKMVRDKTGGLFRLAARLMIAVKETRNSTRVPATKDSLMLLSNHEEEENEKLYSLNTNAIIDLVNQLACYFQIRDDLMNLTSLRMHQTKGYCDDITEGKFSFVAIYALKASSQEQSQALLSILAARTRDLTKIEQALGIIRSSGAFAHTFQVLNTIATKIHDHIFDLGGNPQLSILMKKMEKDVEECKLHA